MDKRNPVEKNDLKNIELSDDEVMSIVKKNLERKEISQFFRHLPNLEDQKKLFADNPLDFTCGIHGSHLRSNRTANNTLCLVCKSKTCGRSSSFRLA